VIVAPRVMSPATMARRTEFIVISCLRICIELDQAALTPDFGRARHKIIELCSISRNKILEFGSAR
jgi:hypothetical protein